MGRTNRSLSRKLGNRQVRKVFVVAVEGEHTERIYFGMFSNKNVRVHPLPPRRSGPRTTPRQVLNRLKEYVSSDSYDKRLDELWLVIDRDDWDHNDLDSVAAECTRYGYRLAVTNPKFEFWLLLHQTKCYRPPTAEACDAELYKLFPDYKKDNLDLAHLGCHVGVAIEHARRLDEQCPKAAGGWPLETATDVYRLVERILEA